MSRLSKGSVAVRVALVSAACLGFAGIAEARPIRGPVLRAERRVWRAQMALERELTRPAGRGRMVEVPVYPVHPGVVPGAPLVVPPAVPAQAVVPAPAQQSVARPLVPAATAAPPAAPGVTQTAFEAPLPEATSDGTVSVLVRPEGQPAGSSPADKRAGEPLLFPAAAQP